MSFLPYAVAGWLFFAGLYGIVTSRNYIHLTVCLTVMQSSTYVLLLAIGYRERAVAPIFKGISRSTKAVDPVVQALALTDIVVSVVVVALILSLAIDMFDRARTVDPDRVRDLSAS
jgi:multicomponent Na+:H+ antiporter subunit C